MTESDTIPAADADAAAPEAPSRPGAAFYERVAWAAGAELVDGLGRLKAVPDAGEPSGSGRPSAEPAAAESSSSERPLAEPAGRESEAPATPVHLRPALEAVTAAKAAARRVRAGGDRTKADERRLWLVWSSYTGASLEQVQELRPRPLRPRRQVLGPLPYATTWQRAAPAARAAHLTVPPYMAERPEIRTDLTAEPSRPAPSERFSRFRAQVEKTSEQHLDEDPQAFQGALPATLPVQSPPSVWRRLARLLGIG